jgi:hypothetical protein
LTGLKTGLRALDNPERHTPWEDLEQQITVLWLDITHPEAYAMTTAIPLGGLRPSGVGGSLKGQGVKLGYPDLLIDFPSVGKHGLRIEMKKFSKSASPSKEQVPWLERLSQQGYGSYVCKGHAAAIRVIKQYIKVQSTYILPESPDWATVRY